MTSQKTKLVVYGVIIYLCASLAITWSMIAFSVHFLGKGDIDKWGSANGAMVIGWFFSLFPILLSLVFVIPFFSKFPETFDRKKVIQIATLSGILLPAIALVFLVNFLIVGFVTIMLGVIAMKYIWQLHSNQSVEK
jgi:hypothetical protein